jgi:hypothetical protein
MRTEAENDGVVCMDAGIIGCRVHYVSHGTPIREDGTQAYTSRCRPAVITEVSEDFQESGMVGLCVINPTGLFFHPLTDHGCEIDKGSEITGRAPWSCDGYDHAGGTWHIPGGASGESWDDRAAAR